MSHVPLRTVSAATRDATPSIPLVRHSVLNGRDSSRRSNSRPFPDRCASDEQEYSRTNSRNSNDVQTSKRSGSADRGPNLANAVKSTPFRSDVVTTKFRIGLIQKPFNVATDLLDAKSPYFAALHNRLGASSVPSSVDNTAYNIPAPAVGEMFMYPDVDEFAFNLFVHWLNGGNLNGPYDFHSTNHYVCLYVLAKRFQIEELQNNVMDLMRAYYHREGMTAPTFRLRYIYSNTDESCAMRQFLVFTAAYRASATGSPGLSESIRVMLRSGGDVAPDFADALVEIGKDDTLDVRKGDNCLWHVHERTERCKPAHAPEPFEVG